MKLVSQLLALAFFTASFDLVLVLHVGGSLRFAQICLMLVILAAFAQVLQQGTILWPRGGYALALWCLIQAVLIQQSLAPLYSLQIYFVLLLAVFGLFAVLQLYGASGSEPGAGPGRMPGLLRVYLLSYVFIAACGLLQFVMPSLHLGYPLIVQWIKFPIFPRLNGFNYEPSYYATYMILGWITLLDLRIGKARIVAGRRWRWYTVAVFLALLLSTSKGAWVFIALEVFLRARPYVWRFVHRQSARLRVGSLVFPLPAPRMVVLVLLLGAGAAAGLAALDRLVDLNIFLAGSGLNHSAAHSLNDRVAGFIFTVDVIRAHPWIGRSLGGVAPDLAFLHGNGIIQTPENLKIFQGFPVPLDMIAASGFLGVVPLVWFFYTITFGEAKLMHAHPDDERAKWLHALIRGLAFEWLALCADQNILRVYFWFHVSMVVLVGYNLRYVPAGRIGPAESLVPA